MQKILPIEGNKQKTKPLSVVHRSGQYDSGYLDSELWEAFRNDSMLAYKAIYMEYADLLFNYGRKIIAEDELIKDSIQDFFVELWNRRKNLDNVKSIRAYLFVGFRRKLLEKKKKMLRFQRIDDTENFEIILSNHITLQNIGIKEDKIAPLVKALNDLPERQKEAVFLRFYNKLSCNEIGEILDINSQSVYNLIHRALKILRHVLSSFGVLLLSFANNIY
ncbi:sigma-70 family RNA polymerase sigma factor [Reichenbachiella sp. MALMAid0571]|uniref:RNA polymerase sigma factor n=1 Tax=Reichenbachiella sp. MALMAid0571 TaxID=3143939 RepID=UPI0032DEE07E